MCLKRLDSSAACTQKIPSSALACEVPLARVLPRTGLTSVDLAANQLGPLDAQALLAALCDRRCLVERWVERFDRRGTEPFELFRSEFGQNSCKIQEFSLENSKNSENFNIF